MTDSLKFLLIFFLISVHFTCSKKGSESSIGHPDLPQSAALHYNWSNLGHRSKGYITAITFHPSSSSEIWISGDDGGGLYQTKNSGTTWSQVTSTPKNLTTHNIIFDPTDPNRIYAPSRFGRGFAKSTDGGSNWMITGSGLPSDVSDNSHKEKRKIEGLAIDPGNTHIVYACLKDGLYKSTNHGDLFSKILNLPDSSGCSAIAISKGSGSSPISGTIFIGTEEGGVYRSSDGGNFWTTVETSTGNTCTPVSDISLTDHALYVAFKLGKVSKSTTFTSPLTPINTPDGGACSTSCSLATCFFHSLHWTKLATASGVSAASDIIYTGTVLTPSGKYGLYLSTTGGSSWVAKNTGLNSNSAQSIAVDPNNSQTILYGTFGQGLFISNDSGDTWSQQSTGIRSTIVLGLAEDPNNLNHLLTSGTVGLNDATGGFFESTNRGTSWSQVSSFSDDAIAIDISPLNSNDILISGWRTGIHRSTQGTAGPWVQDASIFPKDVNLSGIIRDQVNPNLVYAYAHDLRFPTSVPAYFGIYFSDNSGANWVQKVSTPAGATVTPHPNHEGEALATSGNDVFATTDSFSTFISLGLNSLTSSNDLVISAAYDPDHPSTILVGSVLGNLYVSENYSPAGSGMTWTKLSTPAQDVFIRKIYITKKGWFALCWMGDAYSTPNSTEGILFSSDRGNSWTFLNQSMGISQLVYDFIPSRTGNSDFLVGLWNGGLLFLNTD